MALAYDNSKLADQINGSSNTTSFTVGAGSNRVLVAFYWNANGNLAGGVTYNGVAMTAVAQAGVGAVNPAIQSWFLAAPASGANNAVVTGAGSGNAALILYSYSGAYQTGPDVVVTVDSDSSHSWSYQITPLTSGSIILSAIGGASNPTLVDPTLHNLTPLLGTGSRKGDTADSAVQVGVAPFTVDGTITANAVCSISFAIADVAHVLPTVPSGLLMFM